MIDYIEEINHNKREKDKINAEIYDLQSRIFVENGRNNRLEVNHIRNKINRLKMKLNDINLRIVELEKMSKNQSQIQVMPTVNLNVSTIKNGEITITDTIEFDCGFDEPGEIIQTITKTVERTIKYRNDKPVSCKEKYNETSTTRRLINKKDLIETSIVG